MNWKFWTVELVINQSSDPQKLFIELKVTICILTEIHWRTPIIETVVLNIEYIMTQLFQLFD